MSLSQAKYRAYLPVVEKIQQALQQTEEARFKIPTLRPKQVYKDLWELRTQFQFGNRVMFSRKEDHLLIIVKPSIVPIESIEVPKDVKKSPLVSISGTPTLTELSTKLNTYAKLGESSIRIASSHLTELESEKLNRLITHLGYSTSDEDGWLTLTKV